MDSNLECNEEKRQTFPSIFNNKLIKVATVLYSTVFCSNYSIKLLISTYDVCKKMATHSLGYWRQFTNKHETILVILKTVKR